MSDGIIRVASCQFPVSADIERNGRFVREFMHQAHDQQADVVHFSECALSGYAGVDFESFEDFDWQLHHEQMREIVELAGQLKIWTLLGSSHRLTPPNKPHNSLYLIGPDGTVHNRYDKRFGTALDLDSYTPGNHWVTFELNGVKCALLICFDLRFPEIYRELYKQGVQCVFQSFYNARQQGPSVHTDIMRQTMQANAANNGMWASMTNSCGWYCPYPSAFIQPDGRIVQQLTDHTEGLMINTVDTTQHFYDPSAPYRDLAINGTLTNGPGVIDDELSKDVTGF